MPRAAIYLVCHCGASYLILRIHVRKDRCKVAFLANTFSNGSSISFQLAKCLISVLILWQVAMFMVNPNPWIGLIPGTYLRMSRLRSQLRDRPFGCGLVSARTRKTRILRSQTCMFEWQWCMHGQIQLFPSRARRGARPAQVSTNT